MTFPLQGHGLPCPWFFWGRLSGILKIQTFAVAVPPSVSQAFPIAEGGMRFTFPPYALIALRSLYRPASELIGNFGA
jgi:hypothetical protein